VNVPVQVECYSGHTYAQEPRAFEWRGGRYEVVRVVKRWRTPTGPAFRVRVTGITDHGSRITEPIDLFYLEAEDKWTMNVQN
jgi:hypothetical protein